MNRRHLIRLTAALPFAFVLACGSDSPAAPVEVTSVAGTWVLTSVDSKPLPFVISASDPKQELLDKRYVMTGSGTFTTSFTLKATELDGSTSTGTTSNSGTYTLANNTVTLTYASDGSIVVATVTPTTMTINSGATQEFARQ
jgi:hypothetical protein